MTKFRKILCAALFLSTTACAEYSTRDEVDALNHINAVGSPFTRALAAEYREFVNRELGGRFNPDALHFSRKGIAAAGGEIVMPEPVGDWSLSDEDIRELSTARGRLIVAFNLGARELAAAQAAIAQARFDCWIEQQEESYRSTVATTCKNQFMEAMDMLESMIAQHSQPAEPVPSETVMPVAQTIEPMRPEDAMYLIFFDWDSHVIDVGGQSVVAAIAEEIRRNNLAMVTVVGHADSSGAEGYNEKLSIKRANAVRDALTNLGIDASVVHVDGRGERELMVKTADGVREPANRRAQVTFK